MKQEEKKRGKKEKWRKASAHFSARGNASCVGFGWCIVNLGAVSGRMPAAAPRKVKFAHDNAANFSRKSGGTVCARSSSPFYGRGAPRWKSSSRFLSYSPDFRRGMGGDRGGYIPPGWEDETSGVNLKFARGSRLDNREVNPLERLFQRSWRVYFSPHSDSRIRGGEGRDPERSKVGEQVWERRFFFRPWKNNIICAFFDAILVVARIMIFLFFWKR